MFELCCSSFGNKAFNNSSHLIIFISFHIFTFHVFLSLIPNRSQLQGQKLLEKLFAGTMSWQRRSTWARDDKGGFFVLERLTKLHHVAPPMADVVALVFFLQSVVCCVWSSSLCSCCFLVLVRGFGIRAFPLGST